ncbi:hypothetical protein ACPCUV_37410 [Streptomyces platensis]|uniref:hypothetical protein n=1 Tax=Streptomyces platensis TaxID=58346 RepID=UPI003C2E78BA
MQTSSTFEQIDQRCFDMATVDLGLLTVRRGKLSDTERDWPISDLSTWTIDRLEVFATAQQGQELERIRVVARSHAYASDERQSVRLRWAKLSLKANERLPGGNPWTDARKSRQNFALRTWTIEHLGPGTDRDGDPGVLAADTLVALTLDPGQVKTLSANWQGLPIEKIGERRRHKNMTAHLDRLMDFIPSGPTKDRLNSWTEVRKHLP